MKKGIRYIFLVLFVIIFSCEDSMYITNCDECTDEEPLDTIISAKLDESNKNVLVILYEGRIEDNIIVDSTRIFSTYIKYQKKVSLNRTYTITATYIINNKSYTVVDSKIGRAHV